MTAQTSRAPECPPMPDQVTPVIIKSGSGPSGASSELFNQVSIDSIMRFKEVGPSGPTWKTSQSTLTGRITELSITDGPVSPIMDYPVNPSDELASITIQYAGASLEFSEFGDPKQNEVLLMINSSVSFRANDSAGPEWRDSNATFPSRVTRVLFKVGQKVITDYQPATNDVMLNINYNRNPVQ